MSTTIATEEKQNSMEKHNRECTSSSSGTIPPTPTKQGFGFGGVPYRASISITSKLKTTPHNNTHKEEVGYISRLDPNAAAVMNNKNNTSTTLLSPGCMNTHEPYTPSIYSPQTPLGWTSPPTETEVPAPLTVKKGSRGPFDPESVAKPSYYELEKPYGGTKHFMMAHGLRYYDYGDCEIRKEILEQLKNLEWQNRVNTAREEFARTGKVSAHLMLSEVASEYRCEVEEVAVAAEG